MNTTQLTELLQLSDPSAIMDRVAPAADVLRWFVDVGMRRAIAERCIHPSQKTAWLDRLEVPNQPGHFNVPVVIRQPEFWRLSAKAVLLPMRWQTDGHDEGVPATLRQLADSVAKQLKRSPRLHEQVVSAEQTELLRGTSLGLGWSLGTWNDVNLTDLNLSPESAQAPLATGLASFILRQSVSQRLLVTGAWNNELGKWDVGSETLAAKLQAGLDAGLTAFGLPSSYVEAAQGFVKANNRSKIDIIALADEPHDWYSAILPALLLGGVEPDRQTPSQTRCDWYLSRPTNNEADDFYRRALLKDLAEAQRVTLKNILLESWRPDHLVSIVSNSEVLIQLATSIFKPRNVHLIHTGGSMHSRYEMIAKWIDENNKSLPEYERTNLQDAVVVRDEIGALPHFAHTLERLCRQPDRNSVLLDATPGKRAMQLAMMQGAQKGDRILCWWHNTHQGTRRVIPFSEKMLLWEVTADGVLKRLDQAKGHAQSNREGEN